MTGAPAPPVPPGRPGLPAPARRYLASGRSRLVYAPYQTATWRIERRGRRGLYLKAAGPGVYPTLHAEKERLIWLADRDVPVADVVDYGQADGVEWLVTAAVAGVPFTNAWITANPKRWVPLLAEGLARFHAAATLDCPFDHTARTTLAHAAARVEAGRVRPGDIHPEYAHHTPETALAQLLASVPDEDDLVLTHGDYCFPNVLTSGSAITGYIDVGEAGIGARWRDLAVATWSVTWNVGPGYEDLFLSSYGADWDIPRRDFYRLLYDLES